MLGTYTFYVAYTLPSETISLCNTAVMGTTYVRNEPLAESIEVQEGTSVTLSVSHVYARDTIGNVLAIDLRLGTDSEFTSVQLLNGATATEVTIDATGLAVGNYTLKLESFDING